MEQCIKGQINLFQPDILEGNVVAASLFRRLLPPASVLLFLSVLVGFYVKDEKALSSLREEIDKIEKERDEILAKIEDYRKGGAATQTAPQVKAIDQKLRELIEKEKVAWSYVLQEVSLVVPEGAWLTRFETDPNEGIRFEGFASSYSKMGDLISLLESSKVFDNVLLDYSRVHTERKYVEFGIQVRLTTRPPVPKETG